MNSSCPICRNKMVERNNATIFMFNYLPYGISIYFFIKKVTLRILKIIMVFMFFYKLSEFYLILIFNRSRRISNLDDDEEEYEEEDGIEDVELDADQMEAALKEMNM
jgi:hypothetical protein